MSTQSALWWGNARMRQLLAFISYSRENAEIAHQITEVLERGGHRAWIDNQLVPGQRWKEKLYQAIDDCDAFLFLLSQDALASEYCQWEYAIAIEKQKPIFPVLVAPLTDGYPEQMSDLANIHYADMSAGVTATSAAALIGGLFQARPVTQTRVPLNPTEPSNPPVTYSDDALPTSQDLREDAEWALSKTEPLTRSPLADQSALPEGISAQLQIMYSPSLKARTLPIYSTHYTVGRASNMNLVIPERRISKHHLTIYWGNSRFFVVDYSLNGTWLNGERLQNNRPVALDPNFGHRFVLAHNNTECHFKYLRA
ncbi:MAG: TIR domain-containing protein [Anaerolineae bacterium]